MERIFVLKCCYGNVNQCKFAWFFAFIDFAVKLSNFCFKPEKTSDRTAQPEISYDNLDPLSNFMMLMGKQQKEILPWSTISKSKSKFLTYTNIYMKISD